MSPKVRRGPPSDDRMRFAASGAASGAHRELRRRFWLILRAAWVTVQARENTGGGWPGASSRMLSGSYLTFRLERK